MKRVADVVVIGGGIWGLSTAYHLSRRSAGRVLVVDRASELAAETTSQSAGQVGQLRGDPVLARAVGYTLQTLSEFRESTGHDPGFVRSGSIHVALTPARVTQFRLLEQAARENGYAANAVSVDQIVGWAPAVHPTPILAALHLPEDGYVDARRCALAYGAAAIDGGAEILLQQEVLRIRQSSAHLIIETPDTQIETPRIVLAGGPWTQRLTREFGFVAPFYPIRLQQARTVVDQVADTHPVLRVPDESCYLRPEGGGYLFGFFDPEPLAIDVDSQPKTVLTKDVDPEPSLIRRAVARLAQLLPRLAQLDIAQYRQGMMTCTPDGKFVLGPLPDHPHVFVATGCGGTGIAASAAVGRWLSEWLLDGAPRDDISQYGPARFAAQTADFAWLRAAARATSAAYYRL